MATSRTARRVVHLMHDDVLLDPNLPLPVLGRDDLASLSQFVQDVWTATPDWRRFPDDELLLRALPIYSVHGDICFELENPRHPGVVRRYLYERVRGILIVRGSRPVKDDSETGAGELDRLFSDCALRIVAAYEQGPASSELDRRVEFHESFAPGRAPGFAGISGLAHRIVDHWFSPRARGWTWSRRFFFTLSGSITFFLFWTAYVVGSTEGFDSLEWNLVIATFLGVSVVGSPWFAGITAWKDLNYGPVRLFLSGFLLPYLVWTLVAIMNSRPFPDFSGSRESTSDVRLPPAPIVPAPPRSLSRFDTLQPSEPPS